MTYDPAEPARDDVLTDAAFAGFVTALGQAFARNDPQDRLRGEVRSWMELLIAEEPSLTLEDEAALRKCCNNLDRAVRHARNLMGLP
ncbi:MAG: hypothetical protein OXC94_02695 [Chloroflexi bacterium]|nr:hypothetical protein [Chloroflexota bacterium]